VRLHRAPLVGVALAMIGGIVAGKFVPLPTGFWALCAAAGLILATAAFFRPHLQPIAAAAIAVTILALAAVHVRLVYFAAAGNHIATYTGERPIPATIRGQVVTSPQIVRQETLRGPSVSTSFLLQAWAIRTGSSRQETTGLVAATVQQADTRLAAGQELEVMGWLGRFGPPANPGGHDRTESARRNQTLVWMKAPAVESVSVLSGPGQSWYSKLFWRLRAASRQHLLALGDEQNGRLLDALLIGERHPALQTLNRAMMRAGTAHLLAISGQHLSMFLGFIYLLWRLAAFTPRRSAIVVLSVLATYMLLAEPNAPLLRSAVMAAAVCLAVIFRRGEGTLNALAAATVIILAIEPLQLFSAGFQLSFGIVTGMVLLHQPVRGLLFGRWLRQRGLMVFRNKQRLRRWLYHGAANWGIQCVTMSVTAYLVSAPLVAYHFGLFSPYAAPLGLLMAPLLLAVLVPGYVSLALAWPTPNLSAAIGELAAKAADALAWAAQAATHLPALSLDLRPVGVAWVLLCFAAISLLLIYRRLPRPWVWALAAAAVIAAATVYTQRAAPAPPHNTAELNLLAVGGGQCAILRTSSGQTFVFDAGTRSQQDVYEGVIRPFLRDQRLPVPTAAFVSHENADHYGAIAPMARHGGLDRVYLNDYFGTAGQIPPPVKDFFAAMSERDVPVFRLHAGDRIRLDDATDVEVLWPPAQRMDNLSANDTSLVLRVRCGGKSALLTGDLEALGQAAMAGAGEAVRCDVLLLPHHGGWENTLPEFLHAAKPGFVLLSNWRDPQAPTEPESPRALFYAEVQSRYRCYSTARNGWIQVRLGEGDIEVKTMR